MNISSKIAIAAQAMTTIVMIRTVLADTRDGSRCGGRDTDHPGVIIRPRGNMKVFFFHRLRREAQARERDLYYDEDRMRWKYPPTRWFVGTEAARRSGGGRARSPG